MDMESFEKAIAHMVEVWNQFSETIEEAQNVLLKIFGLASDEEKKKAKGTSPKKYGMSLVSNSATNSSVKSYNYIPLVRRNLPYQRRKF